MLLVFPPSLNLITGSESAIRACAVIASCFIGSYLVHSFDKLSGFRLENYRFHQNPFVSHETN